VLSATNSRHSVTITSIARLYIVVKLFFSRAEDPHYTIGYTITTIEINLAIITASVPTLWPLARRWFPSAFECLGINRPYMYPNIEVGYATRNSNSHNHNHHRAPSRTLRAKVSWQERRHVPSGAFDDDGGHIITDIRSQRAFHTPTPTASSRSLDRSNEEVEDEEDLLDTYHGFIRERDVVAGRHSDYRKSSSRGTDDDDESPDRGLRTAFHGL
jgi:hypothetical protein